MCLIFAQTYTLTVTYLSGCLQWTLMFLGDLTKPPITIAGCRSWQILLKFGILFAVRLCIVAKIRHCLPELWKCIQWFTFSRTHCRMGGYTTSVFNKATPRPTQPRSICTAVERGCSNILPPPIHAYIAAAVAVYLHENKVLTINEYTQKHGIHHANKVLA